MDELNPFRGLVSVNRPVFDSDIKTAYQHILVTWNAAPPHMLFQGELGPIKAKVATEVYNLMVSFVNDPYRLIPNGGRGQGNPDHNLVQSAIDLMIVGFHEKTEFKGIISHWNKLLPRDDVKFCESVKQHYNGHNKDTVRKAASIFETNIRHGRVKATSESLVNAINPPISGPARTALKRSVEGRLSELNKRFHEPKETLVQKRYPRRAPKKIAD